MAIRKPAHTVAAKKPAHKTPTPNLADALQRLKPEYKSNTPPPSTSSGQAAAILQEAAGIVEGARQNTHGDKERSFIAIANAWNTYLAARKNPSAPISATDVAWMMSWMKTVRSVQGTVIRDHSVDAAGYAAIAGEIGLAGHT